MALQTILEASFRVTGREGFENARYTTLSPCDIRLADGINYAASKGGILPSVVEDAVFRMESGSCQPKGHVSLTRTAVIYFVGKEGLMVAVDDLADTSKNVLYGLLEKGIELNEKGCNWTASKKNPLVKAALERAKSDGRVVSPLGTSNNIFLTDSEFRKHEFPNALFRDIAPEYGAYLKSKGEEHFYIFTDISRYMEDGFFSDRVVIRPVTLSGKYLYTANHAIVKGRARGIIYR